MWLHVMIFHLSQTLLAFGLLLTRESVCVEWQDSGKNVLYFMQRKRDKVLQA